MSIRQFGYAEHTTQYLASGGRRVAKHRHSWQVIARDEVDKTVEWCSTCGANKYLGCIQKVEGSHAKES